MTVGAIGPPSSLRLFRSSLFKKSRKSAVLSANLKVTAWGVTAWHLLRWLPALLLPLKSSQEPSMITQKLPNEAPRAFQDLRGSPQDPARAPEDAQRATQKPPKNPPGAPCDLGLPPPLPLPGPPALRLLPLLPSDASFFCCLCFFFFCWCIFWR